MNNLNALFGKKVAGIPVVYLAGLFVAMLVVIAWRMKSTPDKTDNAEEINSEEDSGITASGEATSDYGFAATRGTVTVTTPSGGTETAAVPDTNELWARRAIEWLIAQGESPADAQRAISLYLEGSSLSYAQGQMRDKAVRQFGLPPDPVTPGTTAPAPARRQGNPPITHVVKGLNDNAYSELAYLYYSRKDNVAVDFLQAANLSLGHSGPFPVGTKVKIPVWRNPRYVTAKRGMTTLAQIASKNSTSQAAIKELNDGMKFPVSVGKKVRVA